MKEIVLVCTMGISTAFIVQDMLKTAKRKKIDINIRALAQDSINEKIDNVDVILLAPPLASQLKFFKQKVAGRIPIILIPGEYYNRTNGEMILLDTLNFLEQQ
ncbi:hypothetical protein [Priestia aryabhattai]|uniref:hypothetical protein n=1 Tax=Priestia aryabhattai TaxID=412384 RepID=UPI0032E85A5F